MDAPKLWQYNFSNYNEKARWALDYKEIGHQRRSLMPGEPMAMRLTLRGTLPALDLDGERYADSTDIIAALERFRPEPALYPADPGQRRRALELEDFFDEGPGHDLRRALFWEVRDDRDYIVDFLGTDQPRAMRALMRAAFPLGWAYMSRRYSFSEADAERSWQGLADALDRIEAERDGSPYLVGGGFSVADLTAASLLWPLAWPPELQYDSPPPPEGERLADLREHPAVAWIGETYARHRGSSAELG